MDTPELVVIVEQADAASPETTSLVEATRDALGAYRLTVRAGGTIGAEAPRGNDVEVVVRWAEGGRRAHLRLRTATTDWLERDLGFDARDAATERGRAVGLTLASLVPEVHEEPPAPRPPPVPSPPPVAERSSTQAPAPVHAIAPRPRFDLALRGQLAIAVGGEGGGLGGSLEGQFFVGRYLGVHALLGARGADAPYAEGVASHLHAGVGVAVRVRLGPRLELGPTLDLLLVRDGIRHLSPDFDEPEPIFSGRVLPGARADLRLSYFLTDSAALELGAGSEVVFGVTDVYLERRVTGTLVPVRLALEPGIRVRF